MDGGEFNTSPVPLSPLGLGRMRQGIYRLFGASFLYPDKDRLAGLRAAAQELQQESGIWEEAAFAEPMRQLLVILSELDPEAGEPVEEEYARLFLAKPAAPPYEAYYLDPEGQNRVWIQSELEREYATVGLALAPSLKDLPDHIAVELELMSFLCAEEARAWEARAKEDAAKARERQRAFLGQHLGRWFPQFARRVREATSDGIFGVIIEAAYGFLHHELDRLDLRGDDSRDQSARSQ